MQPFTTAGFWEQYDRLPAQVKRAAESHDGDLVWFWTGSHADYDRLIS